MVGTVIVHDVSEGLKPAPVTVTTEPGGPTLGDKVTRRCTTVKVAEAEEAGGPVPVTVMM